MGAADHRGRGRADKKVLSGSHQLMASNGWSQGANTLALSPAPSVPLCPLLYFSFHWLSVLSSLASFETLPSPLLISPSCFLFTGSPSFSPCPVRPTAGTPP